MESYPSPVSREQSFKLTAKAHHRFKSCRLHQFKETSCRKTTRKNRRANIKIQKKMRVSSKT